MSTDYSFYALLCGYMPRPEEVQKRETKVSRFLFFVPPRVARTLAKPPLQKGGWGIGNTSTVVHHHYIKVKKKALPSGKALHIISAIRLLAHITLDMYKFK